MTFFDTAEVYGPFTNEQVVGEDLREIDAAVSGIEIHGARYSEAAQRMVGR